MFSKVIRRTHMYLALFLAPWMLMYAASTLAMNHRRMFGPPPRFEKESEQTYAGTFPPGASPQQMAVQILTDLHMDGAYNVQGPRGGRITIVRQDLVTPRRITYFPADGKLTIEKMAFRSNAFLERFHRRRGFQYPYLRDDVWAATVDLVIAAMIFWALSGLWMWWEMKVTRAWGAVFALAGAGLFAFFVAKI